MHAQAYLAGTSFGQDLGSKDRVKIICVRGNGRCFNAKSMTSGGLPHVR
jgi:hypothetical protein